MMRSLYTGVSGLRNHQTDLDVVSNNIANINTLGFKTGRVTFKEALSQTIQGAGRPTSEIGGRNPMQVGLGMSVATIENIFTQGQFQSTGNASDLAIQGDGFFVLAEGNGQFYSRVGAFHFDAEGRLVAGNGRAVQGRSASADGTIDPAGALGDILVPAGLRSDARATSRVAVAGNLDASRSPIGNVVEGLSLLGEAAATDSLATLRNGSGVSLGLRNGDTVTFIANATAVTRIGELHTETGDPMSLAGATTITVTDGTTTAAITTLTDDSTLADLASAIQSALTSVTVTVSSDGALQFANAGGSPVSLSATVAGTSDFNRLIREVNVASGGTNFSSRADARTTLTVGSGAGEVSTVDGLATALQGAFREVAGAAATVSYGAGGPRFTFTGGGTAVTGLRVVESGGGSTLAAALGLPNGSFGASDSVASDVILDVASAEDTLATLHAASGQSLGISAGDLLTFAASRGGTALAPVSITVGADGGAADAAAGTVQGLLDEISTALGLSSNDAASIGSDGRIVLRADGGTANALSDVSLFESGNSVLAQAAAFSETSSAEDVKSAGSITVYDGLGNRHVVALAFTKDPRVENAWLWTASSETPATIVSGGSGTATFNTDGTLETFASSAGGPLTIDPGTGAASPVSMTLDAAGGGALAGLTQFAAQGEVLLTGQDGYASGVLESVAVDDRGIVNGVFTNGTTRSLAQIVLAKFTNPGGLLKTRDNAFVASTNSGAALIVNPGSAAGTVVSGAVEMSNVDLGQEFTNLIIAQRGFQANARTISTGDEMLAEVVNLKR